MKNYFYDCVYCNADSLTGIMASLFNVKITLSTTTYQLVSIFYGTLCVPIQMS